MNVNLYIRENNRLKLCLISGEREINCLEWQDKNSLSRSLLANFDKLLRKSRSGVDKISGYKIISDVPRKWTTCRIAEIIFDILELAKKKEL